MNLKYGLDERPRVGEMLLYSLQWLLIAIPVVLTSTFIAPPGETVAYAQKLFGITGAAMLIQVFFGHRMPLIPGPAAALLTGILAATAQGCSSSSIYTAIFIGGAIIALAGISGITRKLLPLFTPRIVVVVLMLISFTIAHPIIKLIFSDPDHYPEAFCFALFGTLLMAFANERLKGVWKTVSVSAAMIVGSLLWFAITGFPEQTATDTHPARVFNFPAEFDLGVTVSFLFCYAALFINEAGSVQSLGAMVGAGNMERRNRRAMTVTGIMNMVSGGIGTIGPVDYSLSPGIVASTSCASRWPIVPAAVILTAVAFWPQGVSVLMTIPSTVMGCVLLFLMATQIAAGFEMANATKSVSTFRHGMIIGLPLMLDVILSFAPNKVMEHIPSLIRPIAGNGFVAGVIIVLLLEHVLLRERKNVRVS